MVRRSPIRHTVRNHTRRGRSVSSYDRGSGVRARQHTLFRRRTPTNNPTDEYLKYPITAQVINTQIIGREYDYDERVSRPVRFQMTIVTDEDPRGHEDEEWIKGAINIFPTMDNSIREGYTVDDVRIIGDPYNPRKYVIKLYLKRGVEDIETEEHEAEYMRKLAEGTLPGA